MPETKNLHILTIVAVGRPSNIRMNMMVTPIKKACGRCRFAIKKCPPVTKPGEQGCAYAFCTPSGASLE